MRAFLRFLLAAAAVTLALALQLSVLPQVRLPYAVPDLVLLVVVSLGVAWGQNLGAVAGFAAGLAVDLAPPSVTATGRHAIVLTLVGALAGRLAPDLKRSALRTSAIAGILAGLATLGNAVLGSLLGEGGTIGSAGLPACAAACALYTAIATPFILPGLAALARRAEGRRTLLLAPVGNAIGDPVAVRTAGQ
ncbi:rod shape-determining protein MreD [Actinospica sp. MGRD01-02]|uniref:Rod shape-determining protein MreD n=1 Tax=Actinospica acidithermotolerans TaxID=2828514 RepID=A0A941E9W7_9ACTN|nr:rod shape-determining protein MreD [Actinospica acidithermotolerans]MBR7826300.1 rod shape-determining protein MreD [Actinospica acidithermotolerans]